MEGVECHFNPSKNFSLGVELELFLIDSATKRVVSDSPSLIKELNDEGYGQFKAEFNQSTIEIFTPVMEDVEACRNFFYRSLPPLIAACRKRGVSPIASGTPPLSHWRELKMFPDRRYEKLFDSYQLLMKRMAVCGLHVHVGMPSCEAALAVMEGAIKYLPALLALSANSPFWGGEETGLESMRFSVLGAIPTVQLPPSFADVEAFSSHFIALRERGIVEKMRDIHWHIRPRFEFGTVEFRICDMPPTIEEVIAITALIQSLCVAIVEKGGEERGNRGEIERILSPFNLYQAWRYGLRGRLYSSDAPAGGGSIAEDIHMLLPSLSKVAQRLGCSEEVGYIDCMIERGSGSTFQKEAFYRRGQLRDVAEALEATLLERALL